MQKKREEAKNYLLYLKHMWRETNTLSELEFLAETIQIEIIPNLIESNKINP